MIKRKKEATLDHLKFIWISDNGKWGIQKVEDDNSLTCAWVIDMVKKRGFEVMVEHIVKGQKLLYGNTAEKTYDNVVTDKPIPMYLQKKIISMRKVDETKPSKGIQKLQRDLGRVLMK